MVQTVFRLENHDEVTPVRLNTARLASSPACESCAENPCLAAILNHPSILIYANARKDGLFQKELDRLGPQRITKKRKEEEDNGENKMTKGRVGPPRANDRNVQNSLN